MRILRVLALAALPLSLPACAARMPPPSTFLASEWAAVEAIAPGTLVEVRYVAAGPPPLSYSFRGNLVSADADLVEIESAEGRQRLLAEQVLSVATVQRGDRRIAQGGALGVVAGILGAVFFLVDDGLPVQLVMTTAGIGLGFGAMAGALAQKEMRTVVYRRRSP